MNLKDGAFVKIKDAGQEICILPQQKKQLNAMLDGITETNMHEPVDTGTPIGNELW
jgi:antitoxin component of MazEF toxin-antitoxin module